MLTIAIIGGGGTDSLPFLKNAQPMKFTTPFGEPSDAIYVGQYDGVRVAFLSRHGGNYRILAHQVNYRANIHALFELGVDAIIALATVGGITVPVYSLVVPHQLIDYTYGRAQSFDGLDGKAEHIDFTEPFDENLRQIILAAAKSSGQSVIDCGVYAVTNGPRLETAAEIQRLARDGVDIVGMTVMPEAVLAREMAIPYAVISPVVNPAAGIGGSAREIDFAKVADNMANMSKQSAMILQNFISAYPK
jgi:5'-deoxy-5'-methylthioadenosine phosphorylase